MRLVARGWSPRDGRQGMGRHVGQVVPYRCDSQETYRAESKKPAVRRVFLNGTWQCPTLTWGSPTLPSALIRFTSEFGMESGGTVSLWLPGKTGNNLENWISIQS